MPHRRNWPRLSRAALVCSLLSSASFLNACGVLQAPAAPPPPPSPVRPCDLPNQERATELAPQGDLSAPLGGDDWVRLQTQDAAAYNQLYPRYNANLDYSRANCIAKPTAAAPVGK